MPLSKAEIARVADAVVAGSVAVLVLDFIITKLLISLLY